MMEIWLWDWRQRSSLLEIAFWQWNKGGGWALWGQALKWFVVSWIVLYFMKWETENNFKKIEFFSQIIVFSCKFLPLFPLFLFLSLSTLSNLSGKDPRNNKSIESGLTAKFARYHKSPDLPPISHWYMHHIFNSLLLFYHHHVMIRVVLSIVSAAILYL